MGNPKSPAEIGRSYDESSPISDTLNDGQVHMSYWYDEFDRTPLVEAAKRLTRRVVGTLALRAGDRVLDAGCGLGAPALQIAEETGAHVTGITVSEYELGQARKKATAAAMDDSVRFEYGDFTALSFPNAEFDAVIAVESILCAPDKQAALSELCRVLRPGGRIVVADFTRESGLSEAEGDEFAASMGINRPLTLAEWVDAVRSAGLRVDEYTQCGERVFGVAQRYLDGVAAAQEDLETRFGRDIVPGLRQALGAFVLGPDRMGYGIVTAHRPAS